MSDKEQPESPPLPPPPPSSSPGGEDVTIELNRFSESRDQAPPVISATAPEPTPPKSPDPPHAPSGSDEGSKQD